MKKILLFSTIALAIVLALPTVAKAQKVAIDERAPEVRPSAWLSSKQPASAQFTYVEFFSSANKACITSLDQLKAMADKSSGKLYVVVVARESEEKAAQLLKPYLSSQVSVAIDPDGKVFAAYGVSYVPFGVLTDSKNRVVWMGNSSQFSMAIIDKSSK